MEKTDRVINLLRILFSAISIIAFNLNCVGASILQRILTSIGIFIIYVIVSLFVVIASSITSSGSDRYDKKKLGKEAIEKKERRFFVLVFSLIFLIDFVYIIYNGIPLIIVLIGETWDSTPQYP